MKKNVFTIISLISVLSFTHYASTMYDNARAPIPAKMQQLGNGNQALLAGEPNNFKDIYRYLSKAKIKKAKEKFDIEEIKNVKEYCQNHPNYQKIPQDIEAKIDSAYDKQIKLDLIETYIKNRCSNKGWAHTEQELLNDGFSSKNIKKFETKHLSGQLDLIAQHINDMLEEKNSEEIKQKLLEKGFKEEHIEQYFDQEKEALEDADAKILDKLVEEGIINKSLTELEKEFLDKGFDPELVEELWNKEGQQYVAKKYIEAKKAEKSDAEIKEDLITKGFYEDAASDALEEINEEVRQKRLARLNQKTQKTSHSKIKPVATQQPIQNLTKKTAYDQPEQEAKEKNTQPQTQRSANPKTHAQNTAPKKITAKQKPMPITHVLKNQVAPKNPDNPGNKGNSFWSNLFSIKTVKYTLLTTITTLTFITLYKLLRR